MRFAFSRLLVVLIALSAWQKAVEGQGAAVDELLNEDTEDPAVFNIDVDVDIDGDVGDEESEEAEIVLAEPDDVDYSLLDDEESQEADVPITNPEDSEEEEGEEEGEEVEDGTEPIPEESSSYSFPPIYVLNLDRAQDRWDETQKEMARVGVEVTRLPAIDGRALSKQELRKESTPFATFFNPRGVLACYMSHRMFWQKVVDDNLPAAVIFEDDVKLIDSFKDDFQTSLEAVGDLDYDVILLG
jgi:glycosyl transferase family 25